VLFGSEGTSLAASQALAQACANLLIATGHIGRPNNGLLGVWSRANEQGAWDMGFRPQPDLQQAMKTARALYILAADPAGDDPLLAETGEFLVVQDLFLTDTARLADVVLPVQAYTEREGSYTTGERRVQRFYPGLPEPAGMKADFAIIAQIGQLLGLELESRSPAKVMQRLASQVPDYAGLSYNELAKVTEQWPIVGRGDMYYGGTTYENKQGLGVQLTSAAQRGETVTLGWPSWPVSWLHGPSDVNPPHRGISDGALTEDAHRAGKVIDAAFRVRIPSAVARGSSPRHRGCIGSRTLRRVRRGQ